MPRLAGRWQRHTNTRDLGDAPPPPPPPLPQTEPPAAARLTVQLLLVVGPGTCRATCGQLNTGCSTVQLRGQCREGSGLGSIA